MGKLTGINQDSGVDRFVFHCELRTSVRGYAVMLNAVKPVTCRVSAPTQVSRPTRAVPRLQLRQLFEPLGKAFTRFSDEEMKLTVRNSHDFDTLPHCLACHHIGRISARDKQGLW